MEGLMQYSLRPATGSDYDFLYQLKVTCLKEYITATWGWDETFQKEHFASHFDPQKSQIIMVNGEDVGELSVQDLVDELFLSRILIQPAYQGRGLGTALIQNLQNQAAAKKVPLSLQVLTVNPAYRLYRRLGFQVVERSNTHYLMKWRSKDVKH
jgi:ribosomal protein S18 acetylase RimI-like enzyme